MYYIPVDISTSVARDAFLSKYLRFQYASITGTIIIIKKLDTYRRVAIYASYYACVRYYIMLYYDIWHSDVVLRNNRVIVYKAQLLFLEQIVL